MSSNPASGAGPIRGGGHREHKIESPRKISKILARDLEKTRDIHPEPTRGRGSSPETAKPIKVPTLASQAVRGMTAARRALGHLGPRK